jgi:hypothetical protein
MSESILMLARRGAKQDGGTGHTDGYEEAIQIQLIHSCVPGTFK